MITIEERAKLVEKLIKLGDDRAHCRMPREAIAAYAAARATDKLIAYGEVCFCERWFDDALRAYAHASTPPPKEKLITYGDSCLADAHYKGAIMAYAGAGANDKLIYCGKACLKNGNYTHAALAYALAKMAIPQDDILACGEKALYLGYTQEALAAFSDAGATDKLIACGDKWLAKGYYMTAACAYAAAIKVQIP